MSAKLPSLCKTTQAELLAEHRADGTPRQRGDVCPYCPVLIAGHDNPQTTATAVPATGGNRSGLKRKSLPVATSGNQWKAHYLQSLDIHILPTCSLATLLGGGIDVSLPEVSGLGQAVLKSCEVITEASVAADPWLPNPTASDVGSTLLKYMRLIVGTEKMGLESVVDDMVIHLFAALGFNTGRLLILSKNTLKFTMNKDPSCEATADVVVYDVASKFRLAVVEDKRDPIKSSPSDLDDNEAQLVAEAIAAAQANNKMSRIEQAKRPRSSSEGGASGSTQVAASAEQAPVLFLLRVVGDQFSFYSTRMSAAFLDGVADYDKLEPQQVTCVYRLAAETQAMQCHASAAGDATVTTTHAAPALVNKDRWQFKVPAERRVIIEALDRFRQIMLT